MRNGQNMKTMPKKKADSQRPKKVTYWAGMRIEGDMIPFDKREDALSKWHTGIANGQLFEKIDFPHKC